MSFIKKAVKKVFKFAKRLVKNKIFQIVAIIALSVFTAGIAAGGFAAFSGVSSVSGFFTAVGQTMATGAASIAKAVGLKGLSASLASKGGAAAIKAGLVTTAETASAIATSASAAAAKAGTAGQTAAAAAQGATAKAAATMAHALPASGTAAAKAAAAGVSAASGTGTTFSKIIGHKVMGEVTVGQLATNAALAGFKASASDDARKRKYPNGYVAGDVARGGGSYTGGPAPSGGEPVGVAEAAPEEMLASNTAAEIGEQGETLAAQMARDSQGDTGGPVADYARGEPGPTAMQQFAQQEGLVGGEQEAVADQGAGTMLMEPQTPTQGLLGENPFADQATRIAYNPRSRGLMGAA